ncbi:AsmA family protein [Marinomonas agarivorans]|nr:AsmA family protein [Marinomonas agarivorans]
MIWAKRLGITLLFFLAIFIALISYITLFVDPNDFKDKITTLAKEQANIELRLDGDIRWSFFPWVGVELEDIGVAFAGEQELVRFGAAEFGVELLPLLSKSIRIDTLKLIDLEADLIVDEKGQTNWQASVDSTASSKVATPAKTAEPATQADRSTTTTELNLPDLHLSLLSVENAQINYLDKSADLTLTAVINLTLEDVKWGESWPLSLSAQVRQSSLTNQTAGTVTNPPSSTIKNQTNLSGQITILPEDQVIQLAGLTIDNEIEADFLPVSPLKSRLNDTEFAIFLATQKFTLNRMSLSTLGVTLHTYASADNIFTEPSFKGALSVDEFNPSKLLQALAIDIPTSDPDVLQKMKAGFDFKGDTKNLLLENLTVNFDDSELTAAANIELSPLLWSVGIEGKNLDLDRYLPAKNEKEAETKSTTNTENNESAANTDESGELIPVELVRSLNGFVNIGWQNLKVANLNIDNITFSSSQKNGVVKVNPLSASLYDGEIALEATLNAQTNTPKITLVPTIKDIQLKPLIRDLTEKEKVTGVADLKGQINTQGNQIDHLINNANGDLVVQILDGALIGTNLTKSVCEGIANYRNETLNPELWGEDTPFESLKFPARIRKGKISTPGLKIQAAAITVQGNGVVSLPTSSFDYTTSIGLTGSSNDHACRIKEEFKTLAFPVQCKGKFSDDPASFCGPDLKGFGKQFEALAKAKLKKKAAAEKARAKKKLEEKAKKEADRLKERLKKLF